MTQSLFQRLPLSYHRLPLYIAFVLVFCGGFVMLNHASAQARDTTRKHHLEDLETALFFARAKYGSVPPYEQPTWCGRLDDPANTDVKQQIEAALREQNTKYANPAKPFPTDPNPDFAQQGYFYWKHSPVVFEFNSKLEAQPTGERSALLCGENIQYDYGITSIWRENI